MLNKPIKTKTCIDMSGFDIELGMFPKTNRKQRIDKKARKVSERVRCEIPGCNREAQKAYHHIIQKWLVIIDHILNFLRLCPLHHLECDEGIISQADQFEIVSHREGKPVEDILKELSDFAKLDIFLDGTKVIVRR